MSDKRDATTIRDAMHGRKVFREPSAPASAERTSRISDGERNGVCCGPHAGSGYVDCPCPCHHASAERESGPYWNDPEQLKLRIVNCQRALVAAGCSFKTDGGVAYGITNTRAEKVEAELAALRAQLAQVERERDEEKAIVDWIRAKCEAMAIILLRNDKDLRRFKIRIEGADAKGKNTTRQISVLAENIEEVFECVEKAMFNADETAEAHHAE